MRKTQTWKNRASSKIPLHSSHSFEVPKVFYISVTFIVLAPYVLLVFHVLRIRINKCCFIEKKAQGKSKKLLEAQLGCRRTSAGIVCQIAEVFQTPQMKKSL